MRGPNRDRVLDLLIKDIYSSRSSSPRFVREEGGWTACPEDHTEEAHPPRYLRNEDKTRVETTTLEPLVSPVENGTEGEGPRGTLGGSGTSNMKLVSRTGKTRTSASDFTSDGTSSDL